MQLGIRQLITSLYTLATGKPVVILCFPNNRSAVAQDVLRSFAKANGRFAGRANVFSINGDVVEENIRFADQMKLPFPLLSDPDHRILSFFENRRKALDGEAWAQDGALVCVVADPNRRIKKIYQDVSDPGHVEEVLRFLDALPRDEPRVIGPHAPVLFVPQVLDQETCQRLIQSYEEGDRPLTPVMRAESFFEKRGNTDRVMNRDIKIRRDYFLSDPAIISEMSALFGKRVIPEMMKVFDYKATRGEKMRIGCYDASDGGFFKPHRDNIFPAGGRRFAMSLNLNTEDFEGGYLRFPEYGPHLYRPATGAALIYSSLIVHEVTPVTAGRRFVLVTFFLA
jgi:peroxiredoxin